MSDIDLTPTASAEPEAERPMGITLRVNGQERRVEVPGRRLLSDALRHDLGLTGTHVGCEHGVCGACTVLLDGAPVRSCLMFAASAQGHDVTTVEGLGTQERMGPVQQAFVECHGLQCGFCTPGFLTTITAYLEENPEPTPDEAREAISGNLCRCTGYQNIVRAVCRAAELRREGSPSDGPRCLAPGGVASDTAPPRAGTTAAAQQGAQATADQVSASADPSAPGSAGTGPAPAAATGRSDDTHEEARP